MIHINTIILSMLLTTSIYGVECSKHPIYCQIKKNSPKLSKKYAMKLSNVIYKAARKHKIPANIYTAILKQESGYSLRAKGCHRGIVQDSSSNFKEMKVCADFGISQVYYRTAYRYGFDISKLTTDLEYSVNAGAQVLSGFKRYSRKDKDYWTRYNCGSRSTTKRDTCQIYKKLVERYL